MDIQSKLLDEINATVVDEFSLDPVVEGETVLFDLDSLTCKMWVLGHAIIKEYDAETKGLIVRAKAGELSDEEEARQAVLLQGKKEKAAHLHSGFWMRVWNKLATLPSVDVRSGVGVREGWKLVACKKEKCNCLRCQLKRTGIEIVGLGVEIGVPV